VKADTERIIRPQKNSSVAPYQQIERWLASAISSGELNAGDRLPPERELASQLGVSRMTLRHALQVLESRGLITRTLGRSGGTFVQVPKIACDLNRMAGFTEQLKVNGLEPGAKVLTVEEVPADDVMCEHLEVAPGSPLYRIERLRLANGDPVALENSWFPALRFPKLIDLDLTDSLYTLLEERYGRRPTRALETLEAVPIGHRQASMLAAKRGSVALKVERIAYALTGEPVEYAIDIFRGDRTKITVWSGIGSQL
jgi:GntR family transcriptional regulator